MSAAPALVGQLRAGRAPLMLAQEGGDSITLRVQVAELWEAIRVVARPDVTVADLKRRVVAEFFPGNEFPGDFVLKIHGWEMLDERSSLSSAGVHDGSILLLAYRRRRAVR